MHRPLRACMLRRLKGPRSARQRSEQKADKERDRLGAPDERGIRGTLIHGGSERSLRTLRAEENAGLHCESLSLFYSHSVRTVNHAPVHEGDTATSLLSVSRTASKRFPNHILPFATTYRFCIEAIQKKAHCPLHLPLNAFSKLPGKHLPIRLQTL